jgi:acetyl-CoA carboxylase biotin carboxyl carrier protein
VDENQEKVEPASVQIVRALLELMNQEEIPEESPLWSAALAGALIELMARYELQEVDFRAGDHRLRLRRGLPVASGAPAATGPAPLPVALPAAGPAPAPVSESPPAPPAPAKVLHEIKSELIGTFYASPSPDAEPYVRVGSRVKKDDVLGLIEAMKVFNEVLADRPGVIVEVCVQNQQPVEFGQVLFRLDPTA